jgi:hypothetical protein
MSKYKDLFLAEHSNARIELYEKARIAIRSVFAEGFEQGFRSRDIQSLILDVTTHEKAAYALCEKYNERAEIEAQENRTDLLEEIHQRDKKDGEG